MDGASSLAPRSGLDGRKKPRSPSTILNHDCEVCCLGSDRPLTLKMSNPLQPAHKGYQYQDLLTAFVLSESLVQRYEKVTVNSKQAPDDRFDDLERTLDGTTRRTQIKYSTDAGRALSYSDFIDAKSTLRLDRLVATFQARPMECRIATTWLPPKTDDKVHQHLIPVPNKRTVPSSSSRTFGLDATLIWPEDSEFAWDELGSSFGAGTISRSVFNDFCSYFVIELQMPLMSGSISEPGELENALIDMLLTRVGIGQYPNGHRQPIDIAGLAIALATEARTNAQTLTPERIEAKLSIRTDFGRIDQQFPYDERVAYNRETIKSLLRSEIDCGRNVLITAPPGFGKSWELTQLARELEASGVTVARHYCYLEPGDLFVSRRVTANVCVANLLAELVENHPDVRQHLSSQYAAGVGALTEALQFLAGQNKRVVLIIDGLDHIIRVQSESRFLASDDTDIIDKISGLEVPDGVTFLFGSQPGEHLKTFRERWMESTVEYTLPPWDDDDITALANIHDLDKSLQRLVISESEQARIRQEFVIRADGNPLLTVYLASGLARTIENKLSFSVSDWLQELPNAGGDITVYYEHLYQSLDHAARSTAKILGVLDFAVSNSELREILPPIVHAEVERDVQHLGPILRVMSGQGGIRVFHESFRRFMLEKIIADAGSLRPVLDPVCEWLSRLGFYESAKSYRFLLPLLQRSERLDEVLGIVSSEFVWRSIQHGHSIDAIHQNVMRAAEVASYRGDWAALVRVVELQNSVATASFSSQNTWEVWWKAFLELYGAKALSERILFDGKATLSKTQGLLACSAISDRGGVAPWDEYLSAADDNEEPLDDLYRDDDPLTVAEQLALAEVNHQCLEPNNVDFHKRISEWLITNGAKVRGHYLVELGARVTRTCGSDFQPPWLDTTQIQLPSEVEGAMRMGHARELAALGKISAAAMQATVAAGLVQKPEERLLCLRLGASIEVCTQHLGDPQQTDFGVGHLDEGQSIRRWVALVRLHACLGPESRTVILTEKDRIKGEGWYRCWLTYVIKLAEADALGSDGASYDIVSAFEELKRDTRPFVGKPRACDLYSLHRVIEVSISDGLQLLRTEAEFRSVFNTLRELSTSLGTRLDQEDGGPLSSQTLVRLLTPFCSNPVSKELAIGTIRSIITHASEIHYYYPTHSELETSLAIAAMTSGDKQAAYDAWQRAAQYQAAYGWRKDPSIYDLLNSIPPIAAVSTETALTLLKQSQGLVEAVTRHTDGRSTKGAPNSWLQKLAIVQLPKALALLAESYAGYDGHSGWLRIALEELLDDDATCDPVLVDAVLGTVRFEVDRRDAKERVAKRLKAATTIARSLENCGLDRFRISASQIERDEHISHAEVHEAIRDERRRLPFDALVEQSVVGDREALDLGETVLRANPTNDREEVTAHPFKSLLGRLRAVDVQLGGPREYATVLADHLMTVRGDFADLKRILYYFSRDLDIRSETKAISLACLGQILFNNNLQSESALAFALSYATSRGDWGEVFGGEQGSKYFERALKLNREIALQVLSDAVVHVLSLDYYSTAISPNIIKMMVRWGDGQTAIEACKSVLAVMSERLPLEPSSDSWRFEALQSAKLDCDGNQALIAILFSRLDDPQLDIKVAALRGLCYAAKHRTDDMIVVMQWWFNVPPSLVSLMLGLQLLCEYLPITAFPNSLIQSLKSYEGAEAWTVRMLVKRLLDRNGVSIDWTERTHAVPVVSDAVNQEWIRKTRAAFDNEVIEALEDIWPGVIQRLAIRLGSTFDSEEFNERYWKRMRLAWGRDGDNYPETPILLWESEVFLKAMNAELNGLSHYLWTAGSWSPEVEGAVLDLVVPNSPIHIALSSSSSFRPNYETPSNCTVGLKPVPTVGAEDPSYEGWKRLAIVETEYVLSEQVFSGRPVKEIQHLSGVIALEFGRSDIPQGLPFRRGYLDDWYRGSSLNYGEPFYHPAGPVIGVTTVSDWLGFGLVLTPPRSLIYRTDVAFPSSGDTLTWNDHKGKPALRLRAWQIRQEHAYTAVPPKLKGTDIIIRPDFFELLERTYVMPLKEMSVVQEKNIPSRSWSDE